MTNNAPRPESEGPSLEALVSKADDVMRREAAAPGAAQGPAPRGGWNARAVVAALSLLGLVAVLVAQGESLSAPAPDPMRAAEGKAAALVDARKRVFAAWDSTGQLPASLRAVGPPQPLIAYTRTDTSFRFAFTRLNGDSARVEYTRSTRRATYGR